MGGGSPRWTEAGVVALLYKRYPPPEWVVVPNLRTTVGYSIGRESYLDAFAMRCWPGKGLTRLAFEIKVSRSDWLKELRDESKRENGLRLAHQFWFVTPGNVVKKTGEVPEGCGWLQATAGGLRCRVAAKHRDVDPIPEDFVASLLRATAAHPGIEALEAFRWAGRDVTVAEFLAAAEKEVKAAASRAAERLACEKAKSSPVCRLGEVAREVMGWPRWRWPTPGDFRLWVESVKMGVAAWNGVGKDAARALRQAERCLVMVRELHDRLHPGV